MRPFAILKLDIRGLVLSWFLVQTCPSLDAAEARDRLFDSDWRFHRGDVAGAEHARFDDSGWRLLDLPHDWSIEDLPPKPPGLPELEAVTGPWRFQPGDHADWKEGDFDDSTWPVVMLPDTWENHSGHTNENVSGWFRRQLVIPVPATAPSTWVQCPLLNVPGPSSGEIVYGFPMRH